MRIFRDKCVRISADLYLLVAAFLLVLPFKWVISWFAASMIHELSHVAALALCGANIHAIKLRASGAVIETEPLETRVEFITSLSGPVGGLCTLLFVRLIPYVSICALVQSAYNLIPVYPLDGGRAFRCIIRHFCDDRITDAICKYSAYAVLFAMFILAIFLCVHYKTGILPVAIPIFLYFKCRKQNFLANNANK